MSNTSFSDLAKRGLHFKTPSFMNATVSAAESSPLNQDDYKMLAHGDDVEAIAAMNAVPGVSRALSGVSAATAEKMFRGECLGDNIKLSPKQLPEYYDLLPPICEKFGVPVPDLFLETSPGPNAYTFGDKRPFIVISSGLLEYMTLEEVQIVLAHECGHIMQRHCLYSMVATCVELGMNWLPGSALLKLPIYRWKRVCEFSADRAALVFSGDLDKVLKTFVRLSGGRFKHTQNVNLDAYREQLEEYQSVLSDKAAEKLMQDFLVMYRTHPFTSVRSYELVKWSKSPECSYLSRKIGTFQEPRCPKCGAAAQRKGGRVCPNGHFF